MADPSRPFVESKPAAQAHRKIGLRVSELPEGYEWLRVANPPIAFREAVKVNRISTFLKVSDG